MYLHNDKELFNDIVALTAERIGQAQDIVEKDYYVTMIGTYMISIKLPTKLQSLMTSES